MWASPGLYEPRGAGGRMMGRLPGYYTKAHVLQAGQVSSMHTTVMKT